MVAERAPDWYSPADYLARERQAATKSEYVNGCIKAMAGASPEHVFIAANVIVTLGRQLEETDCTVSGMDLRVRIPATNEYRYPDGVVTCGELERDALDPLTVSNPILIVEVLSPFTEAEDRGQKAAAYRTIPSLQAYVLIAQDRPLVEHFQRRADGWLLTEYRGLDAVAALPAINCALPLRAAYRRVHFPTTPAA